MQTLFNLPLYHLVFIVLSALFIGFSKSGIRGIDPFQVVMMAVVFGSKASTGIMLPLLCLADILATVYYKKEVDWKIFWSLMPSMIIGVFLGLFLGKFIDEIYFKRIMTLIVLATLGLLVWQEILKKEIPSAQQKLFTHSMGLIAGFTTMIGNLAGAFANIYFLGLKVPKMAFLGTVSWVFLFINLFKVPLQAFYWDNIHLETLKIDLYLSVFVIIGFFVGVKIVKSFSTDIFRKVILFMTILGSLILIFS
jgi:uncharacterized protein